ncbi:MAG: HAMP domain-containing protein [Opitutae bacterium]|nr:HAMP domain-containing protein [Opitutae bacterium]
MASWWQILDPRRNLRLRASLLCGVGVLVLTGAISTAIGSLYQAQLERRLSAAFGTLAFQISDKLDRVAAERFREVQLAASLAPFRNAAGTAAERRQALEAVLGASPEFLWLGVADPTGNVTSGTHGVLEGTRADASDWFANARSAPYASALRELPLVAKTLPWPSGERTRLIELSAPLTAASGQYLGVVGAYLHAAWVRELTQAALPEAAKRERWGVTVYTRDGVVLADSGSSGWTEPPGLPVTDGTARAGAARWEHADGGGVFLYGLSRSRGQGDYPGMETVTVVRQPLAEVLAPVRELQARIWQLGLLAALALAVAGWFGAQQLTRRLRLLTRSADRIRDGDATSLFPQLGSGDEAAQLSRSLGEMTDRLRTRQDQLETENTRLAAQLRDPTPPANKDEPPARPADDYTRKIRW